MDGIELLRKIIDKEIEIDTYILDSDGNEYKYIEDEGGYPMLVQKDIIGGEYEPSVSMFTDKNTEFTIIEKETEIDIQSMGGVNGFKLIEAPYMAKCLSEGNFDTFTDLLKQSELELMNKIEEVIKAIKQLDKEIKDGREG